MTSFGWKRKAGAKICKASVQRFSEQAKEDDQEASHDEIDWLTAMPKRRAISLEDVISKSERLKAEGAVIAEEGRFWEAIKKWDEALQLVPNNEKILEMKAQALMAVGEVFPALQVAEKVVELSPTWWVGHQALGRALANIGEVRLAMKSFSRAVHLNPSDPELWTEDLYWTKSLLERKQMVSDSDAIPKSTVTVTEIQEDDSVDEDDNDDEHGEGRSLVQYCGGSAGGGDAQNSSTAGGSLKRVPKNYVQMRDPG